MTYLRIFVSDTRVVVLPWTTILLYFLSILKHRKCKISTLYDLRRKYW